MKPRWITAARPQDAEAARLVQEIPGIRDAKGRGAAGKLWVPESALAVAQAMLREAQFPPLRVIEMPRPRGLDVPGAAQAAAGTFQPPGTLRAGVADWLTEYQREGAEIVRRTAGGLLFCWAPGSGKTLGAVTACEASPAGGYNVVVTLAGHKRFWRSEIERLCEHAALVVDGVGPESHAVLAATSSPVQYLILSWEILDAHVEWLLTLPIGWLVLDESHRTSDVPRGKYWERAPARIEGAVGLDDGDAAGAATGPAADPPAEPPKRVRKAVWSTAALQVGANAARVLALTATPVPSSPADFWTQMEIVAPGSSGGWWPYAKRYCDAHQESIPDVGPVWKTDGKSNVAELKARMRTFTHVVGKSRSHKALPPLRRTVHYVPQGELLADRMSKEERARLEGDGTMKSRYEAQIAMAARRKRPFILNLLEPLLTAGKKCVVFTGRHADVEDLAEAAASRFKKVNGLWVKAVHGANTSGAEREAIVGMKGGVGPAGDKAASRDAYPPSSYMGQPGPALLIATAATLGTGTNLQDTDDLIQAMLPYTPGETEQRENRVHRLGGVRRPNVHYVVAEGTVDETIAERLLGRLPACADLNSMENTETLAAALGGDDVDDETFAQGLFATLLGDQKLDSDALVARAMRSRK